MVKRRIKPVSAVGGRSISDPDNTVAVSTNKVPPVFCFQHVMKGYHFKDCDAESLRHVVNKLSDLSQITWDEICKLDRHKKGSEIIHREAIKAPLPNNIPDDMKYLAFRLGGKGNAVFIGYRKERILHIVWIDPKGKVYDHG